MHCFSFYRPLICASLGLVSHHAYAAPQPMAEAALANESELHCHFNRDASTDCTTTYRYTILKPSGREILSRIDFNYAEGDGFEVLHAESTQPGGKPGPSTKRRSIRAPRPTLTRGFPGSSKRPWPFPTCGSARKSATPCANITPPSR